MDEQNALVFLLLFWYISCNAPGRAEFFLTEGGTCGLCET